MNDDENERQIHPSIIWPFPGRFDTHLDVATWLKTTQELRKLGWDITLIGAGNEEKQTINGTEIHNIACPDVYLLRQVIYHLRLIKYIIARWNSLTIVLFGQPSAPWLFPLFAYRKLTQKQYPLFVMDTRTVPMEDMRRASMKDKLRGWYFNFMNRLANLWVDGQTAITKRMAERVQIPTDRLWGVWPSGAQVEQFRNSRLTRHWPTENEPIHLIYIGVLHYERNLMALAKATVMANQEGMKFTLTLTGHGTEKDALETFANQSHGLIRVNNPIPHHEVPFLLAQAHVGVLPFPDEEKYKVSSPIKLFEYMASGMVVMATRIVCHTDVVGNGTYVFWSDGSTPEDLLATLRDVWRGRANLPRMGEEAAFASNDWTWMESAKKLSQALRYGLHQVPVSPKPKVQDRTRPVR